MKRNIVSIDQDKCIGCGLCTRACQEGAIQLVNGKATLIRDDYCDGLGKCLPHCPVDAIAIIEREAASFDEEAAHQHRVAQAAGADAGCSGCAGSKAQALQPQAEEMPVAAPSAPAQSQLRQWPVQIQLAPLTAPYFDGAHLLVAADCAAYAHGNFHSRFMRNRVTLIGCPKLDPVDYSEKLTEIIRRNDIKSFTIVRMEVPCCGGLERAAVNALQASGKFIPWQVVTLSVQGDVLDSLD
ncbi:MAG: 4Fe-4S binding protein [Clostridiales bacterium]|nr:4Fe-4S binding protein [Clostridiales bacterium]